MKDGKQVAGSHRDPINTFEGHEDAIYCIATFPDGEKIVTGSDDKTIRIWSLENGKEMKKWVVKKPVGALVVLKDGEKVVSVEGEDRRHWNDTEYWELWVRDAETGRVVAGPLDGHTNIVITLDISSDGGMVASGSYDRTVILWDTTTWQKKGDPLTCGSHVTCVKFSPAGQLGVATEKHIQIWDLEQRERLAQFNGHADFNYSWNFALTWTFDGAYLHSAGSETDPAIRCWDTSTCKQAGDPWTGHDAGYINHIILNPAGTLLASASNDRTVRLWRLSTGAEVARYESSHLVFPLAFSVDGHFIFSSGWDKKISQWEVPRDVFATAHDDYLARELQADACPSWGKQKNKKSHLDMEIPRRRNNTNRHLGSLGMPHAAGADSLAFSRVHGIKNFFNRMGPSSDMEGKQKGYLRKRDAPEVIDVPLGQATYGDYVASKEDGIRPYSLLFCLSWFQKKEKKPDSLPQVYDVDLMMAGREDDILDVPVPTTSRKRLN